MFHFVMLAGTVHKHFSPMPVAAQQAVLVASNCENLKGSSGDIRFAPSCWLPVPDSVTPAMHLRLAVAVPSREQQNHFHCTLLGDTSGVQAAASPQGLSSSSTESLVRALSFNNSNLSLSVLRVARASGSCYICKKLELPFCLISYLVQTR